MVQTTVHIISVQVLTRVVGPVVVATTIRPKAS